MNHFENLVVSSIEVASKVLTMANYEGGKKGKKQNGEYNVRILDGFPFIGLSFGVPAIKIRGFFFFPFIFSSFFK